MNDTDERPTLAPDDARLVARMRAELAPPPLSPAQRAAFDARVQERIERARRRFGLWPALGAGLAAAAVAALVLVRGEPAAPPGAPPAPVTIARAPAVSDAWAEELLYSTAAESAERDADDEADLPEEYAAIAGLFLD